MTRTAEAKKEPAVKSDADTSASPDSARSEAGKSPEEKSAALVAADLSSVPPATSGSRFFAAGLALSLLLHVGVLAYLQSENSDEIGPGGIQLEAINVDLIPLSEWRSGAPNVVPDLGQDAIDQAKKDQTEAARRDVSEMPPPEGYIKATDGASELAAAEIIKSDPLLERTEEPEKDKRDKPEEPDTANDARGRAKQTQEAADAQVKGGSSVAATPGQISRYALSIQQTLNRHPPRHLGTRGRAVVKFGLTETGNVRFAEIQRSSGSKLIDDAVLAAIWKIAFPAPPGGMSERQRSYTAPIEFR
jgi:TonB family protein